MTLRRSLTAWFSAPFALAAAGALPLQSASAQSWPIGVDPYQRPPYQRPSYQGAPYQPYGSYGRYGSARPAPSPWAYGDMVSDGAAPPPPPAPYPDAAQLMTPEQLAQRCNTGRLVGGLLGGGLGYGLSRQDGRAWAIPLGALLGSQMGCSAAVGRGPRPW